MFVESPPAHDGGGSHVWMSPSFARKHYPERAIWLCRRRY